MSVDGGPLRDSWGDVSPLGFAGARETAAGWHMRARDFDPAAGRFLSPDPVAHPFGVPHVQRYHYALNRPGVLVDPDGETPLSLIGAGIGAIGGAMVSTTAYVVSDWGDLSWRNAGAAAAGGAVGGAIGGACVGMIVTAMVCGAAAGGAGQAVTNAIRGDAIADGLPAAIGFGAIGGGVGHSVSRIGTRHFGDNYHHALLPSDHLPWTLRYGWADEPAYRTWGAAVGSPLLSETGTRSAARVADKP